MKHGTTIRSLSVAALASIAVLAVLARHRLVRANDRAPASPAAAAPVASTGAPGKLVVHEWGTFTGLSASDGLQLPFASSIGADLPTFVFNRAAQAARLSARGPLDPAADRHPGFGLLFSKAVTVATQRMETPVVYFYTDVPREVDVRVDFPKGLITEFYPPVRAMGPAFEPTKGERLMEDSFLSWGRLQLIPDAAARPGAAASATPATRPGSLVPEVEDKTHYAHARETDSAIVRFDADDPRNAHEEKFLFYRGLGNFSLPVTLIAEGGDRFTFHPGPAAIRSAFLIRVEGDRVRFSRYDDVRGRCEMRLPAESAAPADLADAVASALVAEGLYEREARAMVKTWEESWFREQGTGTRLLYTIPRPAADALLPLAISPTPDELVRVLVGRVDVLTPEQEARVASLLTRPADRGGLSADEARDLKALGRFLQPAVERAARQQAGKLVQAAYAVREQ